MEPQDFECGLCGGVGRFTFFINFSFRKRGRCCYLFTSQVSPLISDDFFSWFKKTKREPQLNKCQVFGMLLIVDHKNTGKLIRVVCGQVWRAKCDTGWNFQFLAKDKTFQKIWDVWFLLFTVPQHFVFSFWGF